MYTLKLNAEEEYWCSSLAKDPPILSITSSGGVLVLFLSRGYTHPFHHLKWWSHSPSLARFSHSPACHTFPRLVPPTTKLQQVQQNVCSEQTNRLKGTEIDHSNLLSRSKIALRHSQSTFLLPSLLALQIYSNQQRSRTNSSRLQKKNTRNSRQCEKLEK